MIKNHLKLAFRRLIKNRFYTLINLLGLSVGFASVLIIFLFVRKERSFDKFHSKLERIEYLVKVSENNGQEVRSTHTTGPILEAVVDQIPQVEAYTRHMNGTLVTNTDSVLSTGEEVRISEFLVDQGFFEIFDFDLLIGHYPDFSSIPNGLLLTEEKADLLFGQSKLALGKPVKDVQGKTFTVTGILKNIPENSSLQFGAISSLKFAYPENSSISHMLTKWFADSFENVMLFKEGVSDEDKERIKAAFDEIYMANRTDLSVPVSYDLFPFSEAHYSLQQSDSFQGQIDSYYLAIFSIVALIILFSSLSNYCSLTLSQSVERVKEISVRRTIGARKLHLVANYLMESLLLTSSSFVLALILTELSIPMLEGLVNRDLGIHLSDNVSLLLLLYAASLCGSFIAILYPVVQISSKKITQFKALGGHELFSGNRLIDIINAGQIAIFIFLLAATLFMKQQLDFVQNENLGFNKEQVLMVSVNTSESIFKKDELRDAFKKSPFVEYTAIAINYPTEKSPSKLAKEEGVDFIEYQAEADFLRIFDFQLLQGRALEDLEHHKQYVLLNETAVEALGYDEPIGKEFNGKEIIGVVADFHAESKRELIKPLAIRLFDNDGFGWILMRLKSDNIQAAMVDVLERYEEVTGSSKITYRFFDEQYDKIYASEKVIKYLMQIFTGIALLISFFGVFGSSSYTVRRRVKEISIRKVLGANLIDLNRAINKSGLRYLVISALVAIPLSYWWINDWLAQFSYQINVGAINYAPILIITTLLIVPAMLFQVIKVYHSKTVSYLKDE